MEDQRPYEWAPRRTTLHGREAYEEMRRAAGQMPDVWPHPLADWGSLATIVIALIIALIIGIGIGIGISIGDWLIYDQLGIGGQW